MAVNLPTELLRSLITVSDLGGYTKAGEALNRSQPAISLQMRRLEDIVGAKLIAHNGKQLYLTEAGERLSVYARQMLHLNDDAVSHFRPTGVSGMIKVGLPTDYAVSYLQHTVTEFAREHAEMSLEICCDLSTNLLDSLHADQINVVVALVAQKKSQYLVQAWEERPIWAAGKNSHIDREMPLPLVSHPGKCEYRQRMTDVLKSRDQQWRIAYTSPDIAGLQKAVESGLGVTALTRATLTPNMRELTAVDNFPILEKIRIGLFYKLPRVSEAGRELANTLIKSIDKATDNHFTRAKNLMLTDSEPHQN